MYVINIMRGPMALTQIDIDEDALNEAMRLSGAKTKKETVNLALREFTARHRRAAALEHYAALAARWDFEEWEHRRGAGKDPGGGFGICSARPPFGGCWGSPSWVDARATVSLLAGSGG